MTEAERLAELLHELLSRATPRPWDHFQSTLDPERYYISNGRHAIFASEIGATSQADLGLVVQAVNALPTLLARIAALEDALRSISRHGDLASRGVAGQALATAKALGKGSE